MRVVLLVLAGIALYFAIAAGTLRFAMAHLLFPETGGFSGPVADSVERVQSDQGNEIVIRRYGTARLGCVVFFPGQHGFTPRYDVGKFTAAGMEVLLLAYPGQDGASGRAQVEEIEALAVRAVRRASESCPPHRMVLLGVSLGSMLAIYSAQGSDPACIVLVATAPALSEAIRLRLASKWYTAPLNLLPLSRLVPHDYTLAEGLARAPQGCVVIFQGTEDETPLSALVDAFPPSAGTSMEPVSGGTHSTTFALSADAQVSEIARVLARSDPLPPDSFQSMLQRELLAHFSMLSSIRVTKVDATLLRDAPAQGGTAYPEYYAWVVLRSDTNETRSGAVKVAAVDATHLEVTDFLSSGVLMTDPDAAARVFPAALLADINRRAQLAR